MGVNLRVLEALEVQQAIIGSHGGAGRSHEACHGSRHSGCSWAIWLQFQLPQAPMGAIVLCKGSLQV